MDGNTENPGVDIQVPETDIEWARTKPARLFDRKTEVEKLHLGSHK
jgi:hypothetical protein